MAGSANAAGVPVVDEDEVDAVLAGRFDDPRFTARETAALEFTETFRVDHTAVDKALVDATLEQLSPGELIELSICIAEFTGMGQLFAMLGLPQPRSRDLTQPSSASAAPSCVPQSWAWPASSSTRWFSFVTRKLIGSATNVHPWWRNRLAMPFEA